MSLLSALLSRAIWILFFLTVLSSGKNDAKKILSTLKIMQKACLDIRRAVLILPVLATTPMVNQERRLLETKAINTLTRPSDRQNFVKRVPPRIRSETPGSPYFVRNAVQSVGQSVVRIDCDREIQYNPLGGGEILRVSGTGIVVSKDGHILTNAHVIENSKKTVITLSNGRSFKASIIAYDEFTDLAVIKADVSKEKENFLAKAPLGDSSSLQSGDWVIAVGCPVGLDFTVTLGVVSSPKRSAIEAGAFHLKGSYIQTDAALNSGNSGGPLVNDRGEVVGINTMVRSNTEAIGFAIPINRAKQIYEVLKQGRKPTHAYFGIELASITADNARINNEDPNAQRIPETSGALVLKVISGSPAETAGLRRNDVIVEVAGQKVLNADDAESFLDACKPERMSSIKVLRGESGTSVELQASPHDLHKLVEEKKRQMQFMYIKPPQ